MARKKTIVHDTKDSEIHIVKDQIRRMAANGLTRGEISIILGIQTKTLKKILLSDEEITKSFEEGKVEGKHDRLERRRAFYMNEANWQALKHALDTEDGIREKNETNHTGGININILTEEEKKRIDEIILKKAK